MERFVITINVLMNKKSGLLVAVSDDLKGLYVHARSEEELHERLPVAIRSILEADGHQLEELVEIERLAPADLGFISNHLKFNARIAA